ncbi:helix-turn-helix domain-containing protein [Paracoccus cavernae]|uniref:helix-turn-helix domain-containing protein n=1 Tax=Paracoccus cavernae TaxID=1571207 RepID=UPI003633CF42
MQRNARAMQYTAGDAAKATGKNTATITRAIKSGKISASKDKSGAWRIEPSELHRVFPPLTQELRKQQTQDSATPEQEPNVSNDILLREELATLRERVSSQDQLLADRADQIADLRTRLDREGEERRKLAALLTDQRPSVTPSTPSETAPSRSWWPWRRS